MATSKSKSGSASKAKTKPVAKAAAKPIAKPVAKAAAKPAAKAAPAAKPIAKPAPAAKPAAKPAPPSVSVAEIIAGSEAIGFALTVRTSTGPTTYTDATDEIVVGPPTWFALTPVTPPTRRYLYLIQKEDTSGQIVLLSMIDGAGATRVPPGDAWQRAIVDGTLHLIASDHLLSRPDLVALIGGHEPPPSSTKPPYA